ncbi:hypothetical protein Avbf_03926, partial [Armadillidium vulgare]
MMMLIVRRRILVGMS